MPEGMEVTMADEEKKADATSAPEAPPPDPGQVHIPQSAETPPPGWVGVARPNHRWGADSDGVIWFINGRYTDPVHEANNLIPQDIEVQRSIIIATYRNTHVGMMRWQ
jgi:hypothetical protein